MNAPDFGELEKVLIGETPIRPVLFEFFLNDKLYHHLTGKHIENCSTNEEKIAIVIEAFRNAGYDYVTLPCWFTDTLKFDSGKNHKEVDMNFLVCGTSAEIKARAVNLLKLTADKGKYALGSGNIFLNMCLLRTILQ
ncbi:MAG: hypothetical protein ACPLXM_09465 [Bacteroidales bacterium]